MNTTFWVLLCSICGWLLIGFVAVVVDQARKRRCSLKEAWHTILYAAGFATDGPFHGTMILFILFLTWPGVVFAKKKS